MFSADKISVIGANRFTKGKVNRLVQPGASGGAADPRFISTWDTTQAGSASDTVVLPLLSGGTYSGTIGWGDGTTSALSYANRSHTYASAGTYEITLDGTIEGFQFNGAGDKDKIIDISNWGQLTITTKAAFFLCGNLSISANDAPVIATTDLEQTFQGAGLTTESLNGWDMNGVLKIGAMFAFSNFNGAVNAWDVSTITSFNLSGFGAFFSCPLFNSDIGQWRPSAGLTARDLLNNADAFDRSLADWPISTFTDLRNFLANTPGLSTANYDATLIGWEADLQAAFPGGVGYTPVITINFGGSTYTLGGAAATARASLISTFGWTITDGGGV